MNIVEQLAEGVAPNNDPVGTNYQTACRQSCEIFEHHADAMGPVVVALIMDIQKLEGSIKMFEYNQKWRKRRP